MHLKIRTSATKHRKKTGFLTRKKTRGGRKVLRNQRRIASGGPRSSKMMVQRHLKARARRIAARG